VELEQLLGANHVLPLAHKAPLATRSNGNAAPEGLYPANELLFVLDNAPVLIAYIGADCRYLRVNRAYEEFFGLPVAEIEGRHMEDILGADRFEKLGPRLEQVWNGERASFEWSLTNATGAECRLAVVYTPTRDEQGSVHGFIALSQDITAHALLLAREQKARETAELLNGVGPILAAELDPQKLIQAMTDVATKLTGAEFGTFAPTFPAEGILRSDDITRDSRYAEHAPRCGTPNGYLPATSYLAVPVTSRSGDVLGGLFFGHSARGKFTERDEALVAGIAAQAAIAMDNARLFEQAQWSQNELKRSNEELRRANKDLETFAYSASHDLQEPLRNIAICAQLLNRTCGNQLDGDAAGYLDGILRGALRMENLLQDLLAYARATKYAEGPLSSVDAGEVLTNVGQNLKTVIDESAAAITAGQLPVISMHEFHLAQLLQNLIGNALKYRSQETPRIHVSAVRQQGWWVFSVADNGIGIEPEYADQIFGLFKRLHSRDEYPGSGIGLAICQRIVEQYGGRIWLEKALPGAGSTFSFAVPGR
jgi:PAS domain S-box-containing protein